MMDVLDHLRRALMAGIELINGLGMLEARIARLERREEGDASGIPSRPIKKMAPEMAEHILNVRSKYSEVEWLQPRGPRDQICARFGLTGYQVARALGSFTKRQNQQDDDTSEPVASPETETSVDCESSATSAEPSPDSKGNVRPSSPVINLLERQLTPKKVTSSHHSWPIRRACTEEVMPSKKEYEIDEVDREIAERVYESGSWDQRSMEIRRRRRLTRQQVAGLRAAITSRSKKEGTTSSKKFGS